jgi:programmed cell death protein 5
MSEDEELEALHRRKLLAMQQRFSEEQRQAQMEEQLEQRKQELLRKLLTSQARQRLANLKMVKPEFAEQLELQLIQLAQQRKIPVPITDEQLKKILVQLQSQKRETKIRRV